MSFTFIFGVIFVRAFQLQVLERDTLKTRADKAHLKAINITPRRGTIYDSRMRELAVTMEVDSVYAQPAKIDNIKKTATLLSSALSMDRRELEAKFSSRKSFVWLKRQLDFADAERMKRLDMPGIGFVKEWKRFYPNPQVASHLIGFVGIDGKGLEGIEIGYDEYMAGSPTRLVGERDALGNELFFSGKNRETYKGMNLVLTIDKTMQYIAEKELLKAVSDTKAKGGMAIVMAPRTGEILAIANAPHFNPEDILDYNSPGVWRNKAVTDAFEPGSTFKAFLIAAVFEEGAAKPNDLFFCEEGRFNVADRTFHDVKKFGWLNLTQIIKYSSNIGAAKIGGRLERERLYRYVKDFGFGAKTGIGLPGENTGSVPRLREWSHVTLGNISFGQGLSVTGLQLVTAFSAIANNGYLMKPYVVKEIVNEKGDVVEEYRPSVIRRIISEETAKRVTNILKEVTKSDGTGVRAAVDGFAVAGKTGTAQKPDLLQGGYASDKYVSSFIGFIPADNPELAILIVVDEPSGEFYGGAIAAPVFKNIALQSLAYLGIFPKGSDEQAKPLFVHLTKEDSLEDIREDFSIIPDFSGKTVRSVLRLAREIPLEVKIVGSGKAVHQKPLPGERITQGAPAEVWFK
ncbi:MAG: penicillin-binding protein [Deltaproteobacteria bacterium]|nr:penicillin-binding protein [Deltaproteobacteria bacterium]